MEVEQSSLQKWLKGLLIAGLSIFILTPLVQSTAERMMTGGPFIKPTYFSAEEVSTALDESEADRVFSFESENLLLFLVNDDTGLTFRPYTKKWRSYYSEVTAKESMGEIVQVNNSLFIYGVSELAGAQSIYLQTPAGQHIPAAQEQVITYNGREALAYIFAIDDVKPHTGIYQFMITDRQQQLLNVTANDFEDAVFTLVVEDFTVPQGSKQFVLSAAEIARYPDERAELLQTFVSAVTNTTLAEPITYSGPQRPQKMIFASSSLGDYLSLEDSFLQKRYHKWTHSVGYHLHLEGEFKDMLGKSDTNYFSASLFEGGIQSDNQTYQIQSSDKLAAIFQLYLEKDDGWEYIN
ncbi:MAG: hypothetical protein NUK65_00775 [Firmicutes bacterium]|nr:hypothetical protein [Bacillota bacterium]